MEAQDGRTKRHIRTGTWRAKGIGMGMCSRHSHWLGQICMV